MPHAKVPHLECVCIFACESKLFVKHWIKMRYFLCVFLWLSLSQRFIPIFCLQVSSVLQPNASLILNTTEMIEVYSEFNELITSLTSHTPAFVIIPNDAWMNALLYAPSWERFGYELQMVYQSFQNPKY